MTVEFRTETEILKKLKESIQLPAQDQVWGSLKESIEESRKNGYSKIGNILVVLLDFEIQGDVVELRLSDGGTSCVGVMPVRFIQKAGSKESESKLDEEVSGKSFGGFYRLLGQHAEYEFRELAGGQGRPWQAGRGQREETQGCSMLVDTQRKEGSRPRLGKGAVLQLRAATITSYHQFGQAAVMLIHEQSLQHVFAP